MGILITHHVPSLCSQPGSIASYKPVFLIQSARTVQDTAKEIKIQQVSSKHPLLLLLLERQVGNKLVKKKKNGNKRNRGLGHGYYWSSDIKGI